jgi:hypothetical protein
VFGVKDDHPRPHRDTGPESLALFQLIGNVGCSGRRVTVENATVGEQQGLHQLVVPENVATGRLRLRHQPRDEARRFGSFRVVNRADLHARRRFEPLQNRFCVAPIDSHVDDHLGCAA